MLIHKSCGKRDLSRKPTSEIQVGEFRGEVGETWTHRPEARNSKGRDIGYALATDSCEGVYSVEACTITALDVITAFAVPNPNCSSQSQSVFSGLVALRVAPVSRSPSLLRTGKVLIKPTLSAVDVCKLK
jgi:hypothetical protein